MLQIGQDMWQLCEKKFNLNLKNKIGIINISKVHNFIFEISKKCKMIIYGCGLEIKVIHIEQALFYKDFELYTKLSTLSTVYEVEFAYG